ncbi:MAG: hypothetical protein ABIG61_02245 [Planctomycetota bacterium]
MKKTILFYKDVLYKSILAILICIALIWTVGCDDSYKQIEMMRQEAWETIFKEGTAIEVERYALTQESNDCALNFQIWQQHEMEFIDNLSIEELTAYERLRSTPIDNVPQMVLNRRLLLDVLSEDNTAAYWNLFQEGAKLAEMTSQLDKKINAFNERVVRHNKNVKFQAEIDKAMVDAERRQEQQIRQSWQNYNNQQYQQQLLNSLSGIQGRLNYIQTSIINQN